MPKKKGGGGRKGGGGGGGGGGKGGGGGGGAKGGKTGDKRLDYFWAVTNEKLEVSLHRLRLLDFADTALRAQRRARTTARALGSAAN